MPSPSIVSAHPITVRRFSASAGMSVARWMGWLLLTGCFHMAYVLRLSAGLSLTVSCGIPVVGALLFASMASPFLLFAEKIFMAGTFVCTMKFQADNFEEERFATL